jgi:GTP diphosphokinase / guanosine-3',5'-bis(diphosphate) 3'-diphosphatase
MNYFTPLEKKIKARDNLNTSLIKKAYVFAYNAHKKQKRKSGESYIIHPVSVAEMICELEGDQDSIIAALLHDTIEDTKITAFDIQDQFGKEISYLVESMTKVSKLQALPLKIERSIDAFFQILLSTSKDLRVLCIKLVDRLHNMRTIEFHTTERQQAIAHETLEIYVPIAYHIGFWKVMKELEDISFKILHPQEYEKIKNYYQGYKEQNEKFIETQSKFLQANLKKINIEAKIRVFWRRKYDFYILTHKITDNERQYPFIMGIEVNVETQGDCYRALECIHQLGRPQVHRIRDFIACPKDNGYSAFHTSVFCQKGIEVNIHILSHEMRQKNELGFFKTHIEIQSFSHVLNDVMSIKEESANNIKFFTKIKKDVLKDRMYVFSSDGNIVSLANNSSVIDFLFQLNKDNASFVKEVKINNQVSPLHSILLNGDIIDIIYDEKSQINFSWLNWAKSRYAKKHIMNFLNNMSESIAEIIGKEQLFKYIQRFCGLTLEEVNPKLISMYEYYHCENQTDLYIAIGRAEIEIFKFLERTFTEKILLRSSFQFTEDQKLKNKKYQLKIQVKSENRMKMLNNIIKAITNNSIDIVETSSYIDAIDRFISEFVIHVKTFKQLFNLCELLENIPGVECINKY